MFIHSWSNSSNSFSSSLARGSNFPGVTYIVPSFVILGIFWSFLLVKMCDRCYFIGSKHIKSVCQPAWYWFKADYQMFWAVVIYNWLKAHHQIFWSACFVIGSKHIIKYFEQPALLLVQSTSPNILISLLAGAEALYQRQGAVAAQARQLLRF